jgi:hypothetical protein
MSKHHIYFDLLGSLKEVGCPVCRLAYEMTDRYLASLLHEMVLDIEMRDHLREAQGFCQQHAWQLVTHRDGLGTAIIYRDVLNTTLKKMGGLSFDGTGRFAVDRLRSALRPRSPEPGTRRAVAELEAKEGCLACATYGQMEEVYLGSLLEHLNMADLREEFRASSGLCLPHVRRALQLAKSEETFRQVLDLQGPIWEALRAELDEFIRKHDYRFTSEGFDDERDSWIRAVEAVIGRQRRSD